MTVKDKRKEGEPMDIKKMDISPELREKAMACETSEEFLALAKREGYKLSDEEMEAVSGGGWSCSATCDNDRCPSWSRP